ncbi:MAG: Holliday junction DNA helicase RuvB C-terminal domain-containing protein [Armatimonadota bacterium]
MDVKEATGAAEPFLIRSRLAVVTRGGRNLTEKGREYPKVAAM